MNKNITFFHAVLIFTLINTITAFALDRDIAFASPEIQLVYLSQDLPNGSSVDLGKISVGYTQYSSYLTLLNSGDADLIISSISITGSDLLQFETDLVASVVLPGDSILFRISGFSNMVGSLSAQLNILSDDIDEGEYILDLIVESVEADLLEDLYGPQEPPPRGLLFSSDGSGVGRVGGLNYRFANVNLAGDTPVYWGTFMDENGQLEVKLSLNDMEYTDDEILEIYPDGSDLVNGILQWVGHSTIIDDVGAVYEIYTRFIFTATYTNSGSPVILIEPARLGMDNQIGGLVQFESVSDQISVNMKFEASLSWGTGYQPYLDFYDTFQTDPSAEGVASSFWPEFFWNNQAPRIFANTGMQIEEGASMFLTVSHLSIADDEDIPEDVTFEFLEGTGEGSNPMKHGELRKSDIPLTISDNFSMQDILDGNIEYVQDGSEVTDDNFVFKVSDSRGAYLMDGPYDAFTFAISITIINDPPETQSESFTITCGDTISDQVSATDEEGGTITFEVVTEPDFGILELNETTGEFTIIDIQQAGATFFQYRAYDGNSYSENTNIYLDVAFKEQSIDFPDPGTVLLSQNSITLSATASSGLDLLYSTEDSDLLTLTENVANLLQTGIATIRAEQLGDNCYSAAEFLEVSFCIRPDAPTISASGLGSDSPVLLSSEEAGNQWYESQIEMSGETATTLSITDEGSYTVTMTENSCESPHSIPFVIIITGISKDLVPWKIYPNPVEDWLMIEGRGNKNTPLVLSDMTGRVMMRTEVNETGARMNLSELQPGIYFLEFTESTNRIVVRILKR